MDSRAFWVGLSCLILGSVLGILHLCLVNMSGAALEELVDKGGGRDSALKRRVQKILADVPGHARAAAMARVTCNLAMAIASVWVVARIRGADQPHLFDGAIGLAVSVVLIWIFVVTISEAVAAHAAERVVLTLSPMARALYLVQKPLLPLTKMADVAARKASGTPHIGKQEELADEFLSVVEDTEREGAIDEEERHMIEAVVNFKHRTVEQIMTPRREVEALALTSNLGQVTAFVRKARHSRIPVYKTGGTLDDVVGFFYVKDLLRWLAGEGAQPGRGFDLKHILRPAMYVPATKTVRALAEEFVAKKVHVAVVADEYGGVAGLVSLEDIIEEVFGEIQDEYEKPEDEPPRIEVKLDEGSARSGVAEVDARAYIDDVNEALEPLGVTVPEDDEYDTLGGFVLTHLGRMPEVNESFLHGRMQVTVLEATPTRVVRVRLNVKPEEQEGERDGDDSYRAESAADKGE